MGKPPVIERLFNRDFILLWQGQFVSQLGSQAFSVAMMFWTMEATGSATLMGLLMMLGTLPGVLLGPFAGILADRVSRKKILVLCDAASGLVMLGLAVPFFTEGVSTEILIGCVLAMAVLLGVIAALFRPAIGAAVPDLVPADQVAGANSLVQGSAQLAMIFGQSLGGLLYQWIGAPLLFVVDGLSYLFSAGSESFIRLPPPVRKEDGEDSGAWATFRSDLKEGLGFVWGNRGMRDFLILAAAVNFFVMPILVLLPFLVTDGLGKGAAWYGFLMAGFGGGSLIGYVGAGTLQVAPTSRGWALLVALLGESLFLASVGFTSRAWVALTLLVVTGVLNGYVNILIMTTFQMTTPAELRGRVMGLVMTVALAVAPLGMALGGILGDATDKNVPLIYGSCGALMALSTLLLGTSRYVREFLAYRVESG